MKAAVYYSLNHIQVEDIPRPKIEAGEILVEMKACGVCGSDLMEWYLERRAPLVLGHEPAGLIVEVGKEVEGFSEGDRVFAHHHVPCLRCHYCRRGAFTMCQRFSQTRLEPGGFAEYFGVPPDNLQIDTLELPKSVSFEEATLIEPIGCGIRAMKKCQVQEGDTVAIIGAGPAGVINSALARLYGATQIIVGDIVDYRLRAARQFGADVIVNVQNENLGKMVNEMTEGRGADVVMVTAPNSKAYSSAFEACRKGGTICVFAPLPPGQTIPVSPNRLFFQEIRIVPSYSTSHLETRAALELIRSKRIDVKALITHRFLLGRAAEAFQTAARSKECLKVVILNG